MHTGARHGSKGGALGCFEMMKPRRTAYLLHPRLQSTSPQDTRRQVLPAWEGQGRRSRASLLP